MKGSTLDGMSSSAGMLWLLYQNKANLAKRRPHNSTFSILRFAFVAQPEACLGLGWPVGATRFLGDTGGTDAGSAVACWVVRLTFKEGGGGLLDWNLKLVLSGFEELGSPLNLLRIYGK